MYNWILHKNTYTGVWEAVKREHYNDLFNDSSSKNILRSSSVATLEELINKTDGDEDKLAEIVQHQLTFKKIPKSKWCKIT